MASDLRQLLYFVQAARTEHLGKAAVELRISESTLSRSIARLEGEYGVTFFDRIGRGVRLNAYGRVFLASALETLSALERGEHAVRALAHSGSGRVALGFTASLGARVIPAMLARIQADPAGETPHVHLVLAALAAIRTQLLDGELDLTLGTQPFDDAAVQWTPLFEEGLVVLLPSSHPAASNSQADFAEIAGERILLFQPSATMREAFSALARSTGIAPNVVFSSSDAATIAGLVAAGFGIAVIPASAAFAPPGVAIRPLRSSLRRTIGIAYATSRRLTTAAKHFRDAILRTAAEDGFALGPAHNAGTGFPLDS